MKKNKFVLYLLIFVCYHPFKFRMLHVLKRDTMANSTVSEQEGRYDILQNGAGEILIITKYRDGGPENPRLIYDGADVALLYRSRESAVFLDGINPEARGPLKSVDEVMIAEIDGNEVAREYKVPVRIVKSLEALAK